jgi:hypothetical protein
MLKELNEQTSSSNITWASISNGLIVIKSDSSDPKAKSRVNKLGNEVYERFYRSIAGTITNISVEENKFGETDVRVGLKNEDTIGVLTFKLNSSYGRAFLAQIFNVDFSKQVEFSPWSKVAEDGTKKTRLYLGYGGRQAVEWKLPEGTPEVKWVQTKKGSVVDPVSQAEHEDFLDTKLKELIEKNGLTYNNGLSSISSEEFLEMTKPLSEEEKAQLKKPSAEKVSRTSAQIIDDGDLDDLFNN